MSSREVTPELKVRRKCGAKNRRGLPCRRTPLKGGVRCKIHAGRPSRVERERTIRMYARHLTEEQQRAYETVPVGTLDEELRLARTQLDAYLAHHGLDVVDGLCVKRGEGVVISQEVLPHVTVVLSHIDHIRKLEKTRAELLSLTGGGDFGDVDRWLAQLVEGK